MKLDFQHSGEGFSKYLSSVDEEFIFSRGRTLSLVERFPRAFDRPTPENSVLGFCGADLVCGASIHELTLRLGTEQVRVAAVGAVWTHASFRGRGLGAQLLSEIIHRTRARGFLAIVLWSNLHSFYARSGFRLHDRGWAAEFIGEGLGGGAFPSLAEAAVDALWNESAVVRSAMDWRNIPLPSVRTFIAERNGARVIGGELDDRCFVYESSGDSARLREVLGLLHRRYRYLFVNSSPRERDLYAACGLVLRPQSLTMWLPLTREGELLVDVYVPYIDRI